MKLCDISGIELIKRLKRVGYIATRQHGSHVRLEKFDGEKTRKITVPLHRSLKIGTLVRIIKDAGLTTEEFEKLE